MPLKPIPDEVTVVSRPEQQEKNLSGAKEGVCASYAVDSTNIKRLESARTWGGQRDYWNKTAPGQYTETTVPNTGFELRILHLEYRGNGGRAYKVVDQWHRMFDLREDALIETISSVGILPGGVLPGMFLWSLQGSEMKLIREGSSLHLELLEKSSEEARKPTTTVVPGMVYLSAKGEKFLFLGKKDKKEYWTRMYEYSKGLSFYSIDEVKKKTVYGEGEPLPGGYGVDYAYAHLITSWEKEIEDRLTNYPQYKLNLDTIGHYKERIKQAKALREAFKNAQ